MKRLNYNFAYILFIFLIITDLRAESTIDKFKVAILVPLSGSVSEFGTAIKNGFELAMEDNPTAMNGCSFTIEDSEYNSTKAVTAFHQLASDGVNLVYAFGGPMGEVLAPIAETKKIPILTDGIDPRTTKDRNFVIRLTNPADEYAFKMVDYLLKNNKKELSLVNSDNQYLNSLADGVRKRKGEFELFEIINIPVGEFDFKPILPKLLASKLDAIGLFVLPGQSSALTKLLKFKKDNFLFFGTNFIASLNELEASQGGLEGAIYPSNFVTREFRTRYMNKYRNDSAIKFAGESYDALTIISREICSKDKKLSNEEAMNVLKSTTPRSGVLGNSIYTEDGNGDKYFKTPCLYYESKPPRFFTTGKLLTDLFNLYNSLKGTTLFFRHLFIKLEQTVITLKQLKYGFALFSEDYIPPICRIS